MFKQLLEKFNLTEDDVKTAFYHSSYANLHGLESNERLEFLGDSVINFCTTIALFHKNKDYNEGEMSKLRARMVSTDSLSRIFVKFNLKSCLRIIGNLSGKIQANTVEAIVAIVYLTLEERNEKQKVFEFLNDFVIKYCLTDVVDYKTKLQEIIQQNKNNIILYETSQNNDDFNSNIFLNGIKIGFGTGTNKKEAEQTAAKMAIDTF